MCLPNPVNRILRHGLLRGCVSTNHHCIGDERVVKQTHSYVSYFHTSLIARIRVNYINWSNMIPKMSSDPVSNICLVP